MKLQVDITAENRDDAIDGLREALWAIEDGNDRGTIDAPDGKGATGLFELLDSQPAAETS